jgi:iron complex transport system permease protein
VSGPPVSPSIALQHAHERANHRRRRSLALLAAALLLLFALSLAAGRFPALRMMAAGDAPAADLARRLVLELRLPRCITAVAAGMSLAAAGMVFQTLFANPLVEPGLLGVSQGAAFGAALSIIMLSRSAWMVQVSAALFAFAGLWTSFALARSIRYGGWVLRLVLAGIAVSAMFSAGLGIMKYVADPLRELPDITFWLLGGLTAATWPAALSILPAAAAGIAYMLAQRWRINALSLSEEAAHSLGMAVQRERLLLLVAAVVPTAAVISVAGIVSWVGLIIPHIGRRMFGADTRHALPATMLLGGLFTLACDDLARTMLPGEIPLGILTSLAGAAIFLVLMVRRGIRMER